MTPVVPHKPTGTKSSRLIQELSDVVLSGLEFLGAQAGWIGLQETGGLTFPVRVGALSDCWLLGHQAHGSVWGFTINDEIQVLNDLGIGSKCGDPSLCNLLSCPLIHDKQILGHVALANKAQCFTPQDASVLQGLAHHIARLITRQRSPDHASIVLPASWRVVLDRSAEGILLLDECGVLIHANAAWLHWTGFREEELLGHTAPFPFWVSQHDLTQALCAVPAIPSGALPFRHRDQSLFWCALKMTVQPWNDHLLTIAFLRRTANPSPGAAAPTSSSNLGERSMGHCDGKDEEDLPSVRWPSLDWLALLIDLDHGIEGWEGHWEVKTGLLVRDVEGSRCELVLDWLFPQQHDRNRIAERFHHPRPTGCQLVLEVASPEGSRPMVCTFLPLPALTATAGPRRWLLLVGEVERFTEPNTFDATMSKAFVATNKT